MPGQHIAARVHASRHDAHAGGANLGRGAVAQKAIAGDDEVCGTHHTLETAQPTCAGQARIGVGVAQEDSVIEIKGQLPCSAANQQQLPKRQQAALHDDDIGLPQLPLHPKRTPPRCWPSQQLQLVAGFGQVGLKGGQAVAAADVVDVFDKSEQAHGSLP